MTPDSRLPTPDSHLRIPNMLWVVGGLLCLAAALNYLDRGALGVVTKEIYHDFKMNDADYSYVTAAFLVAYAFMYAGSGYLVDRLGTRLGFAVFIFSWSISQMLHGFTRGKWSLAACRFLLGLSEPAAWPAAAKAVDEWFPASKRALGIGIFNSGTSIGSILAPVVVALVTARFGWRAAFVVTGILGLIWMAAWLVLYESPDRNRWLRPDEYARMKPGLPPPAEAKPAREPLSRRWRLIKERGCWVLVVTRFFTDPVIYFIIFWGFKFLRDKHGFSLDDVARYSWIPFVFGSVGYVFGGWLSGRLMEAGWSIPRARKFVMALGAAVMPVAISAPYLPNGGLAIAAMCFTTLGHALWVSNLQTLPTDMFHGPEIGTVTGFTGSGGAIGGALAQLGTGYVVSHFSYAPIFLLAGLMHPMSAVLTYWLLPDRLIAAGKR
jgi:ACS family hexuronate transporter-like MFS transporter